MSYCLNPTCKAPYNSDLADVCQSCRSSLRLQNRYLALKPIAQGGFGRTFWAIDEAQPTQPRCIIKQFFPQQQDADHREKASELFCQEAQRLRELGNHPQIPALLTYLEQEGHQYLIQEFIDGRNLAQELADEGAFSESQIWQLLKELLPVVQFMHHHQVIHRDIKPANIIRDRVTQKLFLVDLGAAKHATGAAIAQTGTIIGSAEYVAPEQTRGKAIFASDLYSLGATCVHLLTQLSPFDLYDSSEARWVWQDYLSDSVSSSLSQILNKLLENATNRRYQSAAAVLDDFNTRERMQMASHCDFIEEWEAIDEKTAYQLAIHLSFAEAQALVRSAKPLSPSRSRSSLNRSRSSSKEVSQVNDFTFPAMLVLLTVPVFMWCVFRLPSPPPQIPQDNSVPEYFRNNPPLRF